MRYFPILFVLLVACTSSPVEDTTITATKEPNPYGWHLVPIRDQFGDSTGVDVAGLFPGTFANSATLGDTLAVKLEIMESPAEPGDTIFFFRLYEYANIPVRFFRESEFEIDVKAGGESLRVPIATYEDLVIDDVGLLYDIVTTATEPIKVYIDLSRGRGGQSAKYRFEIDPAGLSEVQALLKR